jgi:hypothetical protein
MKWYQIYFIFIKVFIVFQIVAIYMKKHTKSSEIYILSDTIFKVSAGFYLILFFLIHSFPGLEFEDTLILRFSGVIILFDIDYSGLIDIISKRTPWLSPVVKPLEKLETVK